MNPKHKWTAGFAAALLAGLVGAAVVSLATAGNPSGKSGASTHRSTAGPRIANLGTLVPQEALASSDQAAIAHVAADGNGSFTGTYLLGTANQVAYYRLANSAGPDCYAVGPTDMSHGRFGQLACVPDFPDTTPIVDLTLGQAERVMGIAADRVSAIVLLDTNGNVVAKAPVTNNIFSLPAQSRPTVRALAALDNSGTQIYSEPEYPQAQLTTKP
jgi:hypothetical protein